MGESVLHPLSTLSIFIFAIYNHRLLHNFQFYFYLSKLFNVTIHYMQVNPFYFYLLVIFIVVIKLINFSSNRTCGTGAHGTEKHILANRLHFLHITWMHLLSKNRPIVLMWKKNIIEHKSYTNSAHSTTFSSSTRN